MKKNEEFMSAKLDLVTTNVYSKHLTDKLLVCGTCLVSEWPEIVEELNNGRVLLSVCLEMVHLNTAIEKIASILAKGDIKEIVVLTKDGSPHCIGLHFAIEWALKMTKSDNVTAEYYVIEHGKLHKIDNNKIKEKRHLSK
jgi:hypothetical protein